MNPFILKQWFIGPLPLPNLGLVFMALFTYLWAISKDCLMSIDLAKEADKAEAIVQPVPWV